MKKTLFWIGCVATLVVACSQLKKQKAEQVHAKPCLIHPLFFQDDISQSLNFPFWFNDSIIRSQKIATLTYTSYGSALDTDAENDRVEQLPKKATVFSFNRNGKLISVAQTVYSEGIIISNHTFHVKGSSFPYFAYIVSDEEHMGMESAVRILIPLYKKKNVMQYDDEINDERFHFISNVKYHGALSVDSIAHPAQRDWVILGTPNRPVKKYKVKNKVSEKQVTTYTYWNGNYPKSTINPEFPFTNKRTFLYKNGLFNGYIDSTFIDEEFVTLIQTEISYDKKQLPVEVNHSKNHVGGGPFFKKTERISYTFYP